MGHGQNPLVFPSVESFGPRVSQLRVLGGVLALMAVTALPFAFRTVRDTENKMATARDGASDAEGEVGCEALLDPT